MKILKKRYDSIILLITTSSITADLFIAEHGNFTNLSVDKLFVIGRRNTDKSVETSPVPPSKKFKLKGRPSPKVHVGYLHSKSIVCGFLLLLCGQKGCTFVQTTILFKQFLKRNPILAIQQKLLRS